VGREQVTGNNEQLTMQTAQNILAAMILEGVRNVIC
jgi:hypothetical protein